MQQLDPAWSASALSSFEGCPWKHYRTRVLKKGHPDRVEDPMNPAALRGIEVHLAIEKMINQGVSMPEDMETHQRKVIEVIDMARTQDAGIQAELDACITSNRLATGFFDANAWLRAKIDLLITRRDGRSALVLDWKTGARKMKYGTDDLDWTQCDIYAVMLFALQPELQSVVAGYVWLGDGGRVDTKAYERKDEAEIWSRLEERYNLYAKAHAGDQWPVRQSGLCKRHCPVVDCEHNGRRTT